jgi:anti-sigma factor RsiW
MTCEQIRPALIAYHFDALDESERRAIETHLPGCSACVVELVELKRAIDLGGARPSPSVRNRLRDAIAADLGSRSASVPARRWHRPIACAIAAAALVATMAATRALTAAPGSPPLAAEMADQ